MPTPMSGKELVREAKKRGWKLDRIEGSHHIMIKGDKTAAIPVHGNKDLPVGTCERLMKIIGLK